MANHANHPIHKSPHGQIWLLGEDFLKEKYILAGSFEADNSIVYSYTREDIFKGSRSFQPRPNHLLVKVQVPTANEAYKWMVQAAPEPMHPTPGYENAVRAQLREKMKGTLTGKIVEKFVLDYERNITVQQREYENMSAHVVIWAPNGERRRVDGLDEVTWTALGRFGIGVTPEPRFVCDGKTLVE
jgi:hypothetical protein